MLCDRNDHLGPAEETEMRHREEGASRRGSWCRTRIRIWCTLQESHCASARVNSPENSICAHSQARKWRCFESSCSSAHLRALPRHEKRDGRRPSPCERLPYAFRFKHSLLLRAPLKVSGAHCSMIDSFAGCSVLYSVVLIFNDLAPSLPIKEFKGTS